MDKEIYKPFEEKMKKSIHVLRDNLSGIRVGRANPSVLDKLTIEYYGAPTPITQVASVSIPEARVILIQPWESKLLKEIEKEIQKSDLGINPNNDGKVIRLVFPALTEERRRELTKVSKKEGEESKVAIRSIRREFIEVMKAKKKNSEITEDDLKDSEKEIQTITDKYIADIDYIIETKDKEIMEV